MSSLLFGFGFVASLLALVRSTLERRAAHKLPIAVLVCDRYASPQLNSMVIGLACGTIIVLGPLGLSIGLDWAEIRPANPPGANAFVLGIATIFIKLAWAAVEEVIFRGALLPQIAKLTNGTVGLIASSLLFAWGHLERGGEQTPDLLSLLVFTLDGIGFGIAYLATRNLWMSTVWHATKNIWIWLLFSESTFQLTQGLFQSSYFGPSLWIGAPGQAGLLDAILSALLVAVLVIVYRRQIARNLIWIQSQ